MKGFYRFLSSRPSGIPLMASIFMSLIGTSLIIWGIYLCLAGNGFVYLFLTAILVFLSGGLSISVAIGYWSKSTWALYLHFVSIIHLAILLVFLSGGIVGYWYCFTMLIGSLTQLITMLFFLGSHKILISVILAFILVSVSFYYQKTGPSIGIYGTECEDQPDGYCYGPLLGAGFPFQYVLDSPGVSIVGTIGYEDRMNPLMFLLDVLIYWASAYACFELAQVVKRKLGRNLLHTDLAG
jgi:hypothetical protein